MSYWLVNNNGILLLVSLLVCVYIYFYYYMDSYELAEDKLAIKNGPSITHKTKSQIPTQIKFNVLDHECKIPRIDPFSDDVMAIFKPPKLKVCTDQRDLFTVQYDKMRKQYLLRFNKPLFLELFPSVLHYACVFYEIASGSSHQVSWNKGLPFTCRDQIIPRHIQGIVVECYELGNGTRILQRDAFAFVQYPVERNEKNDEKRSRISTNVIMLGIDSMSQMNFQRTMPLTAQFVRQLGWYEMLGFNGVGNNVFESMLTLLSGNSPKLWDYYCDVNKPSCLNAITCLWNHFHNSGYLTAYAEDSPTLEFMRKPVDYHLYPILKVFKEIMNGEDRLKDDYCLGRRESFRYVFESCLQLVHRFINETQKPLFGLFWTKTFSHDDFSTAARVDKDFVRYLELYKEQGLFEKAVVILFSLHGQRKGPLMGLASGFLEERLPMLHIYLPPWYRKQYPDVVQALDVNRHRLCSTYDLHLTIKDLLMQVYPNMVFDIVCNNCMSLLYFVPENRTCARTSIPEQFCSCDPHRRVANSELMRIWAKLIVFRINQYLANKSLVRQCYRLQFDRLITADRQELYNLEGQLVKPVDGIERYHIKFVTTPNAVFIGSILINNNKNIADVPRHHIIRVNSHKNCVDENLGDILCVCQYVK